MKHLGIEEGGHVFGKVNLVTTKRGEDVYKCKNENCGIIGRRKTLGGQLAIPNRYKKKIFDCPGRSEESIVGKIKITLCTADSEMFKNMTETNARGLWVMGVGEPVKILHSEYETV